MIRVAALTAGKWVPTSRFRVRQHIEPLRDYGVDVTEFIPLINKYAQIPGTRPKVRPDYVNPFYIMWQAMKLSTRLPGLVGSWRNHITWLERNFLDGALTMERFIKRPLVFDVDDAIWLMPPYGGMAARVAARRADIVIAGNRYLAEWFSDYAQEVRIVPTAVDANLFRPRFHSESWPSNGFVIGWTGISWNLPYLRAIETPLKRFMDKFTDSELLIVADEPPVFRTISPLRVRHVPWSPEAEAEAVRRMDVGLMPLADDEWARGKCSFKMLQYMASGIPAIVSPVGMNSELLAMGEIGLPAMVEREWYEALVYLYLNKSKAEEFGRTGRVIVEERFSRSAVSKQLARVFKELS